MQIHGPSQVHGPQGINAPHFTQRTQGSQATIRRAGGRSRGDFAGGRRSQ